MSGVMTTDDVRQTLLEQLHGLVGTKFHSRFWVGGKDILNYGEFAGGAFIALVLRMWGVNDGFHLRISSILTILEEAVRNNLLISIHKVVPQDQLRQAVGPLDVVMWGEMDFPGSPVKHMHAGISVDADRVVASSWMQGGRATYLHVDRAGPADRPERPVVRLYRLNLPVVLGRWNEIVPEVKI